MRERITFVHGPEDAFHPDQIQLKSNALYVKSLRAAREDRVTASLYELPQEVGESHSLSRFRIAEKDSYGEH